MNQTFKALSLSYKKAPLEIRERFAFSENQVRDFLAYIRQISDCSDFLLISTCNRTEFYYASEQLTGSELISLAARFRGVDTPQHFHQYFEIIDDSHHAVERLFRVSIGLEAQVVGDLQISNQVKRAYQCCADEQLAGPFLHRLMHTIFFSSKRVVQETSFRDGAASTSYAAAELAKELGKNIVEPKVLILGLGEIGEDVCKNLVDSSLQNITICNRTESKAKAIAELCTFQWAPFEELEKLILASDLIISSIGREEPLITKELLSQKEHLSYKFFIDLAVPRSVAKDVEEIPSVLVYNIDTIKSKTDEVLQKRLAAIPKVEAIIQESISEFQDWSKEMEVSPTIQKLKNALEQIRKEELARHMKKLEPEQSELVELVTKSMMQKIIKLPVLQLKAACKRGEADTLIDVLNDLFNLEKEPENKPNH